MLTSHLFAARQSGPRFLVLGAVHGNETCGTSAIQRVMAELESGALTLTRGQVTFVPVCNPRAYAKGVRFVERNLNRYLVPMDKPDSYEAELGNLLCPLLAAQDVVLDIHSYTAGGAAFVAARLQETVEQKLAACLGDVVLLLGWEEAFAATGKDTASDDEGVGTNEYARRFGAQALTLECGQHKDPHAPEIAYQGIRNALAYLGLTEGRARLVAKPVRRVLMKQVFYRTDDGRFARDWRQFDPVTKGQLLATRADGTRLIAEEDGVMVLPNATVSLGGEWFYLGVDLPPAVTPKP